MTNLEELVASLAVAQKETDRQLKETDRQLRETDLRLSERFKATDRQIKGLNRLVNTRWSRLVEALLGSGLPGLFRARGIEVQTVNRRFERFDESGRRVLEIDVMVCNGGEDIAVEVKTTCRPEDVDEHIERLALLHSLQPEYRNGEKKLYGAVAALSFDAGADEYAEKRGLFVLKCGEGVTTIENAPDFHPKAF